MNDELREAAELRAAQARTHEAAETARTLLLALCAHHGVRVEVGSMQGGAAAGRTTAPHSDSAMAELSAAQARTHEAVDGLRALALALCAHHGVRAAAAEVDPGQGGAAPMRIARTRRGTQPVEAALPRARTASLPVSDVMATLWTGGWTRPPEGLSSPPPPHASQPPALRSSEIAALLRNFLLSDAASAPADDPAAPHIAHLTEQLRTGHVLAKTVANGEWPTLLRKMAATSAGAPLKTSTSLLPPEGLGMRLYGSPSAHCAGLLFDEPALGLTDGCRSSDSGASLNAAALLSSVLAATLGSSSAAGGGSDGGGANYYAWPSGYYAKIEFNMNSKGELLNGRKEALTTVAKLAAKNKALSAAMARHLDVQQAARAAGAARDCVGSGDGHAGDGGGGGGEGATCASALSPPPAAQPPAALAYSASWAQPPAPAAFNEILAPVRADAVLCCFARLPSAECVLCALAASCALVGAARLPAEPPLPVALVCAPDARARVLSNAALARAVRDYGAMGEGARSAELREFSLPLALPAAVARLLSVAEVAVAYGAFGATLEAVRAMAADAAEEAAARAAAAAAAAANSTGADGRRSEGDGGGTGAEAGAPAAERGRVTCATDGGTSSAHNRGLLGYLLGTSAAKLRAGGGTGSGRANGGEGEARGGSGHAPAELSADAAASCALVIAARSALRAGNVRAIRPVVWVAIERMAAAGREAGVGGFSEFEALAGEGAPDALVAGAGVRAASGSSGGGGGGSARHGLGAICAEEGRPEMLGVLGAWLATAALLSHAAARRLEAVCFTVAEWLRQSGSSTFRVSSWMEGRRVCRFCGNVHLSQKEITAYMGDRAILNRGKFYQHLLLLQQEAAEPVAYFRRLVQMVRLPAARRLPLAPRGACWPV